MIIANQVGVGTIPTLLMNVPPGPGNLVITVSAGTIFLGTSPSVSATNGAHIIAGVPWQLLTYTTSRPNTLYGVTTAGGSTGVGLVFSSPE